MELVYSARPSWLTVMSAQPWTQSLCVQMTSPRMPLLILTCWYQLSVSLIHLVTSLPTAPVVAMTGTCTRDMEHRLISISLGQLHQYLLFSKHAPPQLQCSLGGWLVSLFWHIRFHFPAATPSGRTSYYILPEENHCIEIHNFPHRQR